MSLQREDIDAFFQKKEAEKTLARLDQLRQVQGVGVVMSELQADPRWAILGNHVEAVKLDWKRQASGYEQALLGNDFMDPKTYGQKKMALAEARGVVKGIELVLNMAKILIERGEEAMQALPPEGQNGTEEKSVLK